MYPTETKSAEDAKRSLLHFTGPDARVKTFHSDNAWELVAAARELGWIHSTATPGHPQSNGVAERFVRTVLEGTRTLLLHAGMEHRWWRYAARCFTFALNVATHQGGRTPWHKRHHFIFPGQLIPFGALVIYKPTPTKPSLQPRKFEPKGRHGIFLGYHMQPGGT